MLNGIYVCTEYEKKKRILCILCVYIVICMKIKYNTRENILLSEVANFSQALMSVV